MADLLAWHLNINEICRYLGVTLKTISTDGKQGVIKVISQNIVTPEIKILQGYDRQQIIDAIQKQIILTTNITK